MLVLIFIISLPFLLGEIANEDVGNAIKTSANAAGEKLTDIGENTNVYAEWLGENLLKFQNFFIGSINFLSLGVLDGSGEMDFARFLFFVLIFMVVYTIVGFVFEKLNFGIAFVISILAMIGINDQQLSIIMLNYEAMGVSVTVILPVLILLAFTFRIYQRAYEGKSKTSPFYAEMFNMIFLVFFGVFFIRHSASEDGLISVVRFISGWVLIGIGIGQTLLYKILARFLHIQRREERKFKESRQKMKADAVEALHDVELEAWKT